MRAKAVKNDNHINTTQQTLEQLTNKKQSLVL
jgi:hypothetical protein